MSNNEKIKSAEEFVNDAYDAIMQPRANEFTHPQLRNVDDILIAMANLQWNTRIECYGELSSSDPKEIQDAINMAKEEYESIVKVIKGGGMTNEIKDTPKPRKPMIGSVVVYVALSAAGDDYVQPAVVLRVHEDSTVDLMVLTTSNYNLPGKHNMKYGIGIVDYWCFPEEMDEFIEKKKAVVALQQEECPVYPSTKLTDIVRPEGEGEKSWVKQVEEGALKAMATPSVYDVMMAQRVAAQDSVHVVLGTIDNHRDKYAAHLRNIVAAAQWALDNGYGESDKK